MNVEHTNPIASKVKKKMIRINVELRNSIDMRWAIARRPEWIQWMQYRKFFLHFYPRPNKKQNKHKQQSWPRGPPQTTTKKHNSRAGPQRAPNKKKKHNSHYSPWWIPYGAVGVWGRYWIWWGWPMGRINTKGEPTNKPRTNPLMFWIVGNPTSKPTLGNTNI